MQNTLLGLAIAVILALVAALVGPLLVDWGTHRSLFEAEASRLLGVDVRVTGPIEARLLPAPSFTLHDVAIGGESKVRVRLLGVEFALGPLIRGKWHASEVHLVGPQVNLGLDAGGKLRAPNLPIKFSPDTLSIDRLHIEDGTLTLSDAANGAHATLTGFWFNGEARSLLGPFIGEGAATLGGELYPFRLATDRASADGAFKLRVNIDPVSRPLSIAADGTLTLAGAKPTFDGTLNLTRPVILASRGPAKTGDMLSQPWRLSGKIKASAASALMEQFEFRYGSDDQGLKLTGVADFKFGKHPRFDGVVSGRQIDLDRALAASDGTQPPPAMAIRQIAQLAGGAFRPAIPIQLGVGIDQVTLGGSSVVNLRGDISTDAGGWNLERFEFRAPGFTQVKLSGQLAVSDDGVRFTGPAEIEANDPKLLAAWLEGRAAAPKGDLQPLKLRGDVTFGSDKIAIERLQAVFERKTVTGRVVYVFADGRRAPKLDATINAPDLDVDSALGFGRSLLAGSQIERPRDMTIAADISHATFGSFVARDASARVKVDGSGIEIDRLAVGDFGGASFSASGRIDTNGHAPRGSLTLDFESKETAAVAALVNRFAPGTAPVGGLLARVNHAKLRAALEVTGDKLAATTVAQAGITGTLDAMTVNLRARMSGDWEKPSAADIRVDGAVAAPDGAALIKLIGLDRYVAVGKGAGEIKLSIAGREDRGQSVDLRLNAEGLSARSTGEGRVTLAEGLRLKATLDVTEADLRPLRPAGFADSAGPLPFSLNSHIAIGDRTVTLDDIHAQLGGSAIRGHVAFEGNDVSGRLDADTVDAMPLLAAAIGMPAASTSENTAWSWSSNPFKGGMFGDYRGEVAFKARQVGVQQLTAREIRAVLRFDRDGLSIDDMTAAFAGGHLTGALSFHSGSDGLRTHAKFSLAGIDAASVLPAAARPPVTGVLDLSGDVTGTGLSPVALIGSLQGSGKIALSDAQFAGLDPRAFDAVTHAVDQGLPIDATRISGVVSKTLDSGALKVRRAEGVLAVSAGQVRLDKATADSKDASLALSGNLDLTDGSIDARMVLSGTNLAGGTRPDIFMALKGPLAAPKRSVDVSALSGWLTLRAVENQARQLRDIENAQRHAPPPAPRPKSELAPALPAPVEIGRAPAPPRPARPEASVGAQK